MDATNRQKISLWQENPRHAPVEGELVTSYTDGHKKSETLVD